MIFIIGFMGVGKSTIGKQLALQMNVNFVDVDKEIELSEETSIAEIFNERGEEYFRKIESRIIRRLQPNSIIACGGGLPCYNDNIKYINDKGVSIYLYADESNILKRIKKNIANRPLINDIKKKDLKSYVKSKVRERSDIYNKANFTINTNNKSETEILTQIHSLLNSI
ncbi:MAG: shikimate kinase [Flavobacteriales bacterium]|jgi:shikimate kinase|nr:shikimate kinase [Flavobacteriales bacterium]